MMILRLPIWLLLALLASALPSTHATDLMIAGAIEFANSFGGLGSADALELWVIINDIPDLSIYSIERYLSLSSTAAASFTFPAVSATKGDRIWVQGDRNGPTRFSDFFGFNPDYTVAAADYDGTESAVTLKQNGALVDILGQIGANGSGAAWQFLDSWTARNTGSGPSTTFNAADWTQKGIAALTDISCATNAACINAYPVNTFIFSVTVPASGGGGPSRPRGPYGADPNKMKPAPVPTATIVVPPPPVTPVMTPAPVSPPPTTRPPPTPSPTPKQTKKAKKQQDGAAEKKRAKKLKDGATMRRGR